MKRQVVKMTYQLSQEELNRIIQEGQFAPEFIGVNEVCQITGYKEKSIYQFVAQNQIPCAGKNGKCLVFKRSDIIQWTRDRLKGVHRIGVHQESKLGAAV